MFGGINFKQLSERFNESLHDLESTLSQAAALPAAGNASTSGSQPNSPARQQPTRAATSPAPSTSSPSRSRPPRPSIETQQARSSQSPSAKTPLSPTSLAQASQSASQLADSALSSLRASLRKGRQSLESAAVAGRTSLEASAASATTPKTSAGDKDAAKPSAEPVKQAEAGASEKSVEDVKHREEPPSEAKTTSEPELLIDVSNDESAAPGLTKAGEAAPVSAPPQAAAATVAASAESVGAPASVLATADSPDTQIIEAAKDEPTTSDMVDPLSVPAAPLAAAPPVPIPENDLADSPPAALSVPRDAAAVDEKSQTSIADALAADDDADDWGMGSISPAPESEPAVEGAAEEPSVELTQPEDTTPTETAVEATPEAVDAEPALSDEATATATVNDRLIAPSDPLRAAVLPDDFSAVVDTATPSMATLVSPSEIEEGERDRPAAAKEEPHVSLDHLDEPTGLSPSTHEDKDEEKDVAETSEAGGSASAISSAIPTVPEEIVTEYNADHASPALDGIGASSEDEAWTAETRNLDVALPAGEAEPAVEDVAAVSETTVATPLMEPTLTPAKEVPAAESSATRIASPTLELTEKVADAAAEAPIPAASPVASSVNAAVLDAEQTISEDAVASVPPSVDSTEPFTSATDPKAASLRETPVAEPAGESIAAQEATKPPSEGKESLVLDKLTPPPLVMEATPVTSETEDTASAKAERDLNAVTESAAPVTAATDDLPATAATETAQSAGAAETVEANVARAAELPSQLKTQLVRILAAVTPLSDLEDLDAVERELSNLKTKADMGAQEIARLASQLDRRKVAFEELRETHRLEHKSQQDEIDELRAQLAIKDKRLASAESAAEETRTDVAKAAQEYDKLKIVAKEEEEKRVKALSLLRALRQKLVKNEKEKEEADKVLESIRATEAQAQETIKADRARFDSEIVALRGAQEQQVNKLKQSFERETANLKAQYDREAAARRGQAELDTITLRAEHAKELAARDARIQQLESTVRELSTARDSIFEQLQERQAEAEASSSIQEALRTRAAELEYEANDARDRVTALQEELEELRRRRVDATRDENATRRLLEEAEVRHSARVRELEARARQLEKDRRETEDEMGRNLQDRLREVERLRAALAKKDVDYAESVQNTEKRDKEIEAAHKARVDLEKRLKAVEASLEALREETARAQQAEAAVKEELGDRLQRATELEARLEEVSTRESTLRSNNRTLRDELRKLQSGVLNSEKQRPAGVGYFSTMSQASSSGLTRSSPSSTSIASMSTIGGGPLSPTLSASSFTSPPASISSAINSRTSGLSETARPNGTAEEALSYEYLRNVILQFLEKPEMRAHLVQVLSVILRFTPAEQRRLAAKSAVQ